MAEPFDTMHATTFVLQIIPRLWVEHIVTRTWAPRGKVIQNTYGVVSGLINIVDPRPHMLCTELW